MTTIQIIANILSFIGNAFFTSSSIFKNKKLIIALQTLNHILSATATLLVKSYSGMVQDCVLLVKNIVLLFVKEDKKLLRLIINILCLSLGVIIGVLVNIFCNNNIWHGYLPVVGIFIYSCASTYVFCSKSDLSKNKTELIIKVALILNGAVWCVYGIIIQLYPVTIFNAITIILSIIAIIRVLLDIRRSKIQYLNENN